MQSIQIPSSSSCWLSCTLVSSYPFIYFFSQNDSIHHTFSVFNVDFRHERQKTPFFLELMMITRDSTTTSCAYRNKHFRRLSRSIVNKIRSLYIHIIDDKEQVVQLFLTNSVKFLESFKENAEGLLRLFKQALTYVFEKPEEKENKERDKFRILFQAFLAHQRNPTISTTKRDLSSAQAKITTSEMQMFVKEFGTEVETIRDAKGNIVKVVETNEYMAKISYLVEILKNIPILISYFGFLDKAAILASYKLTSREFFKGMYDRLGLHELGIQNADECKSVLILCFFLMDSVQSGDTTDEALKIFCTIEDLSRFRNMWSPQGPSSSSSSSSLVGQGPTLRIPMGSASSSYSNLDFSKSPFQRRTRSSKSTQGIICLLLVLIAVASELTILCMYVFRME